MISCSTGSQGPGDPAGPPGPGAGGGFLNLPSIVAVVPSQTCATAGNRITIEGDNLVDSTFLATVTINGVAATVLERFDGGALTTDVLVVSTPAISVPSGGTLANIQVTTPNGSDTAVGAVRLLPDCTRPPTVISISPATGASEGFEPVTLTGDNLACIQRVQFVSTTGGATLEGEILAVQSDQSVVILTPANAGLQSSPFQVVVTSGCGTNGTPRPSFQFTGSNTGGPTLPDATSIVDAVTGLPQGPATGGNTVRISGRDLTLATTVTIGSNTVLSRSAGDFEVTFGGDIIIASFPPSALGPNQTLDVAVTVSSAEGSDPTPIAWHYVGAGTATCATITPNSGPLGGGTQVTITGVNLNAVTSVMFGGVDAGTVFFPTSDGSKIVVIAPDYPTPTDVDVVLLVQGSTVSCTPARFTYVDVNSQPPFSVDTIVPGQGPQTGGTTIVLTGSGLDDVSSVRICDVPATITTAVSNQVQATTGQFDGTVPATCDVVVTTSTGLSATREDGFTYNPVVPDAQAYAGDSARTAPAAGGTFFRLQGVNLIGVTDVGFGGTQAASRALACELDVQSNTQVSGVVPAYITSNGVFPAQVNVVAESAAGVDSTPLSFTYYANPTITDARGPLNDDRIQTNELVTLIGSNFRPVNDVFVGEIELRNTGVTGGAAGSSTAILGPGDFNVLNNGRIEFIFPPSLQVEDFYDVTIRTPGQSASCVNAYSATVPRTLFFGQRPTTAAIEPAFGPWNGGSDVVIRGDFRLPITRVQFCGVDQVITPGSQTDTEIHVVTRGVTAAGATCDVVVFNNAGSADPIAGGFTFVAQPTLTSVQVTTPNCGTIVSTGATTIPVREGQVLTLNGTNFGTNPAGMNKVLIGTAEAIISNSRTATSLDVFVPAAPAGGPRFGVTAQVVFPSSTGGVASTFTTVLPLVVDYLEAPSITSVTPASASANTIVTIAGTNLKNVDGTNPIVTFGAAIASVVSSSDTSVQVIVPTGTPGQTVPLSLTTCQGSAATSFTYPCTLPRITGVAPTQGVPGSSVVITGTDLQDFSGSQGSVMFGTTPATVTSSSPTSVTVLVPPGTVGASVSVSLTTCGGTAVATQQFTYQCSAPAINNVTPGFGVGGTSVTINGVNLDGAGTAPIVEFGNIVATVVTSSSSQVVAVAPPGTGTVDIELTTCGGTATQVAAFTYCVAPNATSVTPATGAEGATVVIGGTNLQDPNGTPPTVSFTAGAQSAPATVVASSPTAVQVQVPTGLSGVATVSITTCGGTDTAGTFRYCATPVISTVSPVTGTAGTQVTLTGSNLVGADGVAATIRFGGTAVTQVIQSTATQFVVIVPAGPSGQVVVDATTCGGTGQAATLFSYCAVPAVTGINPTNGAAGDEVTIFGTDLIGADGVRGTVAFGVTPATIITATATQMTVVAPTGFSQGQAVNVRVTTCGGISATNANTVFTYQTSTTCVAPTVTSFTPTAGAAGSSVTISGSNLIGNDGNPGTVQFGGSAPVSATAATPTQLVVTVPAGTGAVSVRVTTCGGQAQAPQLFTYCQTPAITSLTPSSGSGGSTVLVNGANLIGADGAASQVFFGTAQATIVDATATRLTVVAPMGVAAGTTVNVRVVNCGGTSNSLSFQFVSTTTFDVTGITPSAGPNTGNQIVSITGTGLNGTGPQDIAAIQICDVNATFTQVSDTLVNATTGAFGGSVPTTCDVEVILVNGSQDTLVAAYTYLPPVPDGRTFDTSSQWAVTAPQAGGTVFRILGSNLIGATKVNFGGRVNDPDACNVQAASDVELTGIVPAYTTPLGGPQDVQVFPESAAGVDPTSVEVPPAGSGVLFRYYPNPVITGIIGGPFGTGDVVRVIGTNFTDPTGNDVFIDSLVDLKNTGSVDPTNFPAGTKFDFQVGITVISPNEFRFVFPDGTTGDTFAVTIHNPNAGATCVANYSYTASGIFVPAENNCGNFGDDELDGLTDCADPDCEGDVLCP